MGQDHSRHERRIGTSSSRVIRAASNSYVNQLRYLIRNGRSVNVKDSMGDTPLHYGVQNENCEVFDILIQLDDLELEAENSEGYTPLLLAMQLQREYCVRKLIEKGADVNCANKKGQGLFHFIENETEGIAQLLIEKGASVNAIDDEGETPLTHNVELAPMLLYHGADPSICRYDGMSPLALAIAYAPHMEEILFDYTFGGEDETAEVNLCLFTHAMEKNSRLFYEILNRASDVIYDEDQLKSLTEILPNRCNLRMFQSLLKRFNYLARDLFQTKDFLSRLFQCSNRYIYNPLYHLISKQGIDINTSLFIVFIYIVFTSPHVDLVVQNFDPDISIVKSLLEKNIPLDVLSGLVCCMMSHGVKFTVNDLNHLYYCHNYCELFRIMTHVELKCTRLLFDDMFLMSIIIYDVRREHFDVEKFLRDRRECVDRCSLVNLCRYFAFPKYEEYCKEHHEFDDELLEMVDPCLFPSLVELSRNVARKYIINKYDVQTCAHFNSVLCKMEIGRVYTSILTYEKELYSV